MQPLENVNLRIPGGCFCVRTQIAKPDYKSMFYRVRQAGNIICRKRFAGVAVPKKGC